MALASRVDVEVRLGRTLTSTEVPSVNELLDEASDLAEAYMSCTPEPVPDAVKRVVARMVVRRMEADPSIPVGLTQTGRRETAGPMSLNNTQSFSEGSTSGAPWLTRNDKIVLRRHGCGGEVINVATA